jgi:tetratricopeptide (TPR) repeat protein
MSGNYHLDDKFFEADNLIKESKIGEATALLNEIITEMPEYGRAHNHLGWIFETKLNDYTKAENHYKAALQFTPEYPAVYYNYSILLSTLNRFDELTALLEKAINVPGINKATITNEYGIMYEAQGKYKEAIESYTQYIRYSYDNKNVETGKASIERCKTKMNYDSNADKSGRGNNRRD